MPNEIKKCTVLIQAICKTRKGLRRGQGPDKYVHVWPNSSHGKSKITEISGLRNYVVESDDGTLVRYKDKGKKRLICLAFGDPRSYKILYNAGRVISQEQNTKYVRRIQQELSKKFDCPISVMCRNMNWRHVNMNDIPGIFEFIAFLDRPTDQMVERMAASFSNDRETLDENIYERNNQVKRFIVDRLTALETKMDTMETRVEEVETRGEEVETRVDEVETRVDRVESEVEEVKSRVEKVEDEIEKIKNNQKDDKENVDNSNGSILRQAQPRRRVRFNEQAITTRSFSDDFVQTEAGYDAGVDCLHISNLIEMTMKGKSFSIGVLSSNTTSRGFGRLGVLFDFAPMLNKKLNKEYHVGKVVPFGNSDDYIVVFGLPSQIKVNNVDLDPHDGEGEAPVLDLKIALVDYCQEADGTFSAVALPLGRLSSTSQKILRDHLRFLCIFSGTVENDLLSSKRLSWDNPPRL